MDFNKFLGNLDEGKSIPGMRSISRRKLYEEVGESAEELKSTATWYYVPEKEYQGFRHIVVENSLDNWAIYYLDGIGTGSKESGGITGDEFGSGTTADYSRAFDMKTDATTVGAMRTGATFEEARDLSRLSKYLINEEKGNGEDNGVNLTGYTIIRRITGDFATILKECVNIVSKDKKS